MQQFHVTLIQNCSDQLTNTWYICWYIGTSHSSALYAYNTTFITTSTIFPSSTHKQTDPHICTHVHIHRPTHPHTYVYSIPPPSLTSAPPLAGQRQHRKVWQIVVEVLFLGGGQPLVHPSSPRGQPAGPQSGGWSLLRPFCVMRTQKIIITHSKLMPTIALGTTMNYSEY